MMIPESYCFPMLVRGIVPYIPNLGLYPTGIQPRVRIDVGIVVTTSCLVNISVGVFPISWPASNKQTRSDDQTALEELV